jgi:polyisoprenoid-binding protein YceI
MRTLILAALALVFGVASASAECNWQQTAAKSSVVAKSDQTGAGATSAQSKPPAS